MTSHDEYYKNFLKSSESSLNEGINTATKNAEKSKNIINTKYDGQKQTLQENYDAGVANTNEAYDDAFRKNEIQVNLNERYLERKAAEMGLTDSGLNRTQMTANQLSYANQKGELTRQRQKAIDTLAATMRAKMTDINNNQTADIAEVDMNLNTSIAQMKSDNQKWASEQASEMVKADKEAETARHKADKENNQEVSDTTSTNKIYQYDSSGNVIKVIDKEERKQKLSDLNNAFDANAVSDPDMAAKMIYDFGTTYDLSDAERLTLLKKAGLTEDEFKIYISTGSIYMSASDYNMAKQKNQSYGRVAKWDYKNDGALRYGFKITKATWNWGDSEVDNNDEVTIYYPDGTLVAEKVRIDELPEGIRKGITAQTAGKKVSDKEYDFYYTADLKDSTF